MKFVSAIYFLVIVEVIVAVNYIHKEGYCMWYGQCGRNSRGKYINCLYNGPAKSIENKKSRDILNELCPELTIDHDSKVCCSYDQVVGLQSGIKSAQSLMERCPACWKNFRELYCRLICSPNNSLFLLPHSLTKNNKAIASINYYVEKSFREGLYNSCKDVVFPSNNRKIMNFLCGMPADKCDPLKFLKFMGDPQKNGVSPFLIKYPTSHVKGIQPMNVKIKMCNESFYDPYTKSEMSECHCEDCVSSCKYPLSPTPTIGFKGRRALILFSLKHQSPLNKRSCYRNYFEAKCTVTGTILRLSILRKVLKIQQHITGLTTSPTNVRFDDFCMKSSTNSCIVMSVLQYWQNEMKNLNKCILALSGEECPTGESPIASAAWGDHLNFCTSDPYSVLDIRLGLSCRSDYGDTVFPTFVLGGFEGEQYTDASFLKLSLVVRNNLNKEETEKAKAWQDVLIEYLKNFTDEDLQISYDPIKFGPVMA